MFKPLKMTTITKSKPSQSHSDTHYSGLSAFQPFSLSAHIPACSRIYCLVQVEGKSSREPLRLNSLESSIQQRARNRNRIRRRGGHETRAMPSDFPLFAGVVGDQPIRHEAADPRKRIKEAGSKP